MAQREQSSRERIVLSILRTALVLGYAGTVAACFATAYGPLVLWVVVIPVLPMALVVGGFHLWRRVCPLAFWGEIGRLLHRGKQRRVPAWLEPRALVIPLGLFVVSLAVRLLATNGDGRWLGWQLVSIAVLAIVANAAFTGKSWCNFFCPVSIVERLYTEPSAPARLPAHSACATCTACKKNCPDIDEENGYWKEIGAPVRRLALYAIPGIVLAYYATTWLRSGSFEGLSSGAWLATPASRELLMEDGLFFAPGLPAIATIPITLAAAGVASALAFLGIERGLAAAIPDAERRHHATLALAAFAAFNVYYAFVAGPSPWLLPPGQRALAFAVPALAALLLARRWRRTRAAYLQEKGAERLVAHWPLPEPPPKDPAEVFARFKAHEEKREARIDAYRELVRAALSDAIVTPAELGLLASLRAELDITDKEHHKVMKALTDEEPELLDSKRVVSIDQKRQLDGFRAALESALMNQAQKPELKALRHAYGVPHRQYEQILKELSGKQSPLLSRAREQLLRIEEIRAQLVGLSPKAKLGTCAFLVYALLKAQDRCVDRILEILATTSADPDRVRASRMGLFSDDKEGRATAIARIEEVAGLGVLKDLAPTLLDRMPKELPRTPDETMRAHEALLASPDRYLRAGAVLAAGETKDARFKDALLAALRDDDPLVRETAVYAARHAGPLVVEAALAPLRTDETLAVRRAAEEALAASDIGEAPTIVSRASMAATGRLSAPTIPDEGFSKLATLEKILFLRCVPLFVDLDPEDLHELSSLCEEVSVLPPACICVAGERTDDLYVIVGGSADVLVRSGDEETRVAVLRSGDVVGELAALDGSPRSATVRTRTDPVRMLKIPGATFRERFALRPDIAPRIMATLGRRLRETLAQVVP